MRDYLEPELRERLMSNTVIDRPAKRNISRIFGLVVRGTYIQALILIIVLMPGLIEAISSLILKKQYDMKQMGIALIAIWVPMVILQIIAFKINLKIIAPRMKEKLIVLLNLLDEDLKLTKRVSTVYFSIAKLGTLGIIVEVLPITILIQIEKCILSTMFGMYF